MKGGWVFFLERAEYYTKHSTDMVVWMHSLFWFSATAALSYVRAWPVPSIPKSPFVKCYWFQQDPLWNGGGSLVAFEGSLCIQKRVTQILLIPEFMAKTWRQRSKSPKNLTWAAEYWFQRILFYKTYPKSIRASPKLNLGIICLKLNICRTW